MSSTNIQKRYNTEMITLPSPQYEDHIVFLRTLYEKLQKPVVVGVSGGIDSAVALTLLARVIPKEKIIPVLLPHHLQNMDDAKQIIAFNQIPESQTHIIDIAPMVQSICDNLQIEKNDHIRRGNIKARVRMITLFDLAKKYEAVVCGTENKSEKRLGGLVTLQAISSQSARCTRHKFVNSPNNLQSRNSSLKKLQARGFGKIKATSKNWDLRITMPIKLCMPPLNSDTRKIKLCKKIPLSIRMSFNASSIKSHHNSLSNLFHIQWKSHQTLWGEIKCKYYFSNKKTDIQT